MDLETLKEEVRARADVVDIIGRYVKLQRSSGSWKGLCPFHEEKTPSFHVNPRRQSYHCFGCGAGGDVFNFIMETERLDFMAALEKLANMVGVPFELDGQKGGGSRKKPLLDLHERATQFFEQSLQDHTIGKHAKEYLLQRELQEGTPSTYRLGYAPNGFDILLRQARSWGFEEQDLKDSGLFSERETPRKGETLYDRFRNRLMFPILDEQARVIGFSGRVIPPDPSKAKYMNSPETLLFKKSRVLYGIEKARRPMADQRRAVLCEGQLDVIRCHEAGIPEAVAAQGTAITSEHARIFKRYADELVLLLDADPAGVKAALRSAEVLLEAGLSVRVATLPDQEDPDDVVRKHGHAKLKSIVEAAEPFVLFQVKTLVAQEEHITETSRLRVAREVMETIAKAPEALHREELLKQAAGALGMREEALRMDLEKTVSQAAPAPSPSPTVKRPSPSPTPAPAPLPVETSPSTLPPAEKMLIDLLIAHPEELQTLRPYLKPEHLSHAGVREIFTALMALDQPDQDLLVDAIRSLPTGSSFLMSPTPTGLKVDGDLGTPTEAMQNLVVILRRESLLRTRNALQTRAQASDSAQVQDIELELFTLTSWISSLKRVASHPGKPLEWDKAEQLLQIMDQQGG